MSQTIKCVLCHLRGCRLDKCVCGGREGGDRGVMLSLTVWVCADVDPDAAAGGDMVRRQGEDVAADGRPAQRRLPRAGLPAPHSRRPHGGRLPAWLYTHTHAQTHAERGMLARPGAHTQAHGQTCMFAGRFPWSIHTHGAVIVAKACSSCFNLLITLGTFTDIGLISSGKCSSSQDTTLKLASCFILFCVCLEWYTIDVLYFYSRFKRDNRQPCHSYS